MKVNHIGDYKIEAFAWDGYNIMFTNPAKKDHKVWVKHPTIYNLLGNKIKVSYADASLSLLDVSTLLNENKHPIFDRDYPYMGLTLETDSSNNVFVKAPSITYFNNTPEPESINKFYTATEQVTGISGSAITINKRYQDFFLNDEVRLIKTYKGSYLAVEEASAHITEVFLPNIYKLNSLPSEFELDGSHNIYVLNDTNRATSNTINDPGSFTISTDISGYIFLDNQLVNLLVTDTLTGYSWGSSYRVIDVSGTTHIFDGQLPQFIIDGSSRYTINARHAYSAFTNYEMATESATEINNNFEIYLEEDYRQHFIDSTFVMLNVLFDQEYVSDQWYDPSDNLANNTFYYHDKPIQVNAGSLVIIKAEYDSSTYMLNQKNIFTIKENISKDIVLRVFNESTPFVFDVSIIAESYDLYGNLSTKVYEGLIKVV